MKSFRIILAALILSAPSLVAKNLSVRKNRSARVQQEQPIRNHQWKIDKAVIDRDAFDKTLVDDIKPEKTLRSNLARERTVRADRIGNDLVLKATARGKQRKRTHFREWP